MTESSTADLLIDVKRRQQAIEAILGLWLMPVGPASVTTPDDVVGLTEVGEEMREIGAIISSLSEDSGRDEVLRVRQRQIAAWQRVREMAGL